MAGGSPEKPELAPESQKPPEGSSMKGWFEGLKERYDSALKESEKGKTWKEKIFFFLTAFLTRVDELSEEEQKIEDEAATKTGMVLMQTPNEQIASVVEKELVGSDEGPIDPVVHDFTTTSVGVSKGFGAQKSGKIAKAMDKMKIGEGGSEALKPEEKALLMAFGLKTVGELKSNPAYDTVEKFTAALNKFDEATRNGKGLQYLRQPKIRELFEFNSGDIAKFAHLRDYVDVAFSTPSSVSIGSLNVPLPSIELTKGSISSEELKRKLTVVPLKYNEAIDLQNSFAKLFPNTKPEDRAKALMTISQILIEDKGWPTNVHLAELIFSIDTKDIEKLSEILQS